MHPKPADRLHPCVSWSRSKPRCRAVLLSLTPTRLLAAGFRPGTAWSGILAFMGSMVPGRSGTA